MILKYSDCYMPFVYLMEKILRKTQPGKAANETIINADVKAGEVIIHKSIGKGTVTAVDGDIITVKFNGGSRNFSYGFCIKQGLIWKEK